MLIRKSNFKLKQLFGGSAKGTQRETASSSSLAVEPLEQRLLLAGDIRVSLAGVDIPDGGTEADSTTYSMTPLTYTFTIHNDDPVAANALNITGLTLSDQSSAFSNLVMPASPIAGAGGTSTFSINLDPSVLNTHEVTFDIANDGTVASENPYTFTLSTLVNDTPTAYAGSDRTVDEGDTAIFMGAYQDANVRSDDPVTFEWRLDPTGANTLLATTQDLAYAFETPGNETLRFIVTDSAGAVSTDDLTVTVNDMVPTAVTGGPYSINEGSPLTLDGSASSAPGVDTITNYDWDLDGDAIADATGVNPTVPWATLQGLGLASDGTSLPVTLTVTDSDGSVGSQTSLILVVSNSAPTADAGGPYAITEGNAVTLNASASTDPGNDALTYTWDLDGDGVYDDASGVNPTVSWATLQGLGLASDGSVLPIGVQVDDGSANGVSYDATTLTIANASPTVVHGGPYVINEGQDLVLEAGFTTDAGGDELTYYWNINGIPGAEFIGPAHVTVPWLMLESYGFASDGTALANQIELTVFDDTFLDFVQVTTNLTINNIAPTADAGGPYAIVEGESVVLDGGLSSDVNGSDALTYSWDVDNDGTYDYVTGQDSLALSWSQLETFGLASDGSALTVGLQVDDGDGGVVTDTATLTIANTAPNADAGGPYTITEGSGVTLDASMSSDADANDTLTYTWDLDGDGVYGDVLGANPTVPWATLQALGLASVGTSLEFEVQVSDGDGGVATDKALVLAVSNGAPTANAGGAYTINEGNSVTLDGSASTDPGNDPLSYTWDLDGDGVYDDAAGVNPTVSWATLEALGLASDGTVLPISVRVDDGEAGGVGFAASTLTINNVAPTAAHGGAYTIAEGQDLVLDASGSTDAGNDALTYEWDIDGDGVADATGVTATIPWATLEVLGVAGDGAALVNQISLKVTDDVPGDAVTVATDLTINNAAPTADAGGPYTLTEGNAVTLNAGLSSDPNANDALTYAWDLDGDGVYGGANEPTGVNPTVAWADILALGLPTDGTSVPISVQVTDADGAVDVDTALAVVVSNAAPTADAGGPYVIIEGNAVTLDGSASTDPGSDPLTYTWDLDNDGVYDDASGVTPTISWATLEALGLASDGSALPISVRVDDGQSNGVDYAAGTLTINNVAPVAVHNGPYTITEGEDLVLSAAGTTDAGNDDLTYAWDYDGLPGADAMGSEVTIPWATLEALGFAGDGAALVNQITLMVFDDVLADTAVVSTDLTINNAAPTADAGGPYTITEGNNVTLNAGLSRDPNANDALTYAWDLDGDGVFGGVNEPTGVNPTVTWASLFALGLASDGTTLEVNVQVSDPDGGVDTDRALLLVVNNAAPTAVAGGPYVITEGNALTLDGTGSTDPGNDALTYLWDLDNDGVFDDAAGATPTIPWADIEALGLASDGSALTIGLRVDDGEEGGVGIDMTSTLTINNANPTAVAGNYVIREGEEVMLDGRASTDPDANDTLTYAWDILDDGVIDFVTAQDTLVVPWSYLEGLGIAGTGAALPLSLAVTDGDGGAHTDLTGTLTVTDVAPVADAGGGYTLNEGYALALDGSGSTDVNANDLPLTFAWDLDNDGVFDAAGENVVVPWAVIEPMLLASDGSPLQITLQVTAADGVTDIDTAYITINNLPATVDAMGPYTVTEGAANGPWPLVLRGVATDLDANDVFTYAWDLDNDGNYGEANEPTGGIVGNNVVFTDNVSWAELVALGLPSDGSELAVSLRVDDGEGGVSYAWTTITIQNANPIVTTGGPYVINEGSELALDASGSIDPDTRDVLTYSWDLDNDGDYEYTVDPAGTHSIPWNVLESMELASDGTTHTIGLRVADNDGGVSFATTTLVINNLAPIADAGGPYVIDEGQLLIVNADESYDLDANDGLTYAWDINNDGVYDDATGKLAVIYWSQLEAYGVAGDGSTLTVGLQVTDSDGGVHTDTADLIINNIAPEADAGGPYTILEGMDLNLDASDSEDANANDTLSFAWDIDNDGDFDDAFGVTPVVTWAQIESLVLGTNGAPLTIRVQVTDSDGASDIDATALMINNVPPTVEAGDDQMVFMGDLMSFAGAFSDPGGVLDSHTIVWDFGDGTSLIGSADDPAVLNPEHRYPQSGYYTVSLTITDDDLGQITDVMEVTVVEPIAVDATFAYYHNLSGVVELSLSGPGTMEVYRIDGHHIDGQATDFSEIILTGTTEASTLNIVTKGLYSSVSLGDIIVNGSLNNFVATTATLHGDLSLAGSLGSMKVDTMYDGSSVTSGAADKGFKFIGDAVGDDVLFSIADELKSFKADEYIGGSLTAESIKRVVLTDGVMGADLTATGANGEIKSVVAAGDISGALTSSTSVNRVVSKMGSLTASASVVANDGDVRVVKAANDVAGSVLASNDVRNVVGVNGTLSGVIRAGEEVKTVRFNAIDSALLSSGGDMGRVISKTYLADSLLLAGYDIGQDGVAGSGDEAFNTSGATIKAIKADRTDGYFDGTSALAGVKPFDYNAATDTWTLLAPTGSSQEVANYGKIGSAVVGQVYLNGDPTAGVYGLFAATEDINRVRFTEVAASGAPEFRVVSSW